MRTVKASLRLLPAGTCRFVSTAVFSDLMCLPCRTTQMHDWDGCNLTLLLPDLVLMKIRFINSRLHWTLRFSHIKTNLSDHIEGSQNRVFFHTREFTSVLQLFSSLCTCVLLLHPLFFHLPPASSHSGPAFRACLRSWTTALTRIHEMMQLRFPLRPNLSR